MMWLWIALIAGYACAWLVTYGATLAYFDREYPMIMLEMHKSNKMFAIVWSLIPAAWIAVPFLSKGYKHGFKFK